MIWVTFALWASAVVAAGIIIGPLVTAIGDRLKLGQAWAGTVLLSLATTAPELVTTVSLASRGATGIAIGNIIGSFIFNLFILVFVDLLSKKPLYNRVSPSHLATGLLGCALLGIAAIGVGLGHLDMFGPEGVRLGPIGITALAIAVIWAWGQLIVYKLAQGSFAAEETTEETPNFWQQKSLPVLLGAFAILGAIVGVAAYQLGITVETIAAQYSLGATFAGATLLGVVTSLPELTNSFASTRRGQVDLVLGNLLGANAFLLLVLAIADIFFLGGALFQDVGRTEAWSAVILALTAIVMQCLVLAAISVHSERKLLRLSPLSVVLLALYLFSLAVAYRFSAM